MNPKTMAVLVGISLGGVALGQGTMGTQQQHPSGSQAPSGMQQQPSSMGSTAMSGETKQISGKVLGMKERTLYLESSEGFAVPVTVTKETMVDGKRAERDLKKEIRQGDEVRASFTVKQKSDGAAENIATTIDKATK